VDREHGTIVRLPYGEPLMYHPDSTRRAWMIMQQSLIEKIMDDRKAEIGRLNVGRLKRG